MNISLGKYAPYAKAVAAFIALLVPLLAAIGTALADEAISVDEITMIVAAGGALVAGVKAVYQIPNKPVATHININGHAVN